MSNKITVRASGEALPTPVQPQSDGSLEGSGSGSSHAAVRQGSRPDTEELQKMIAIAAYYRAERRGFASGCELDDWLAAEAEIEESARSQGG